jgi:hypothetical protein
MGHTLRENDCYHDSGRPYSPFLQTSIGKDYDVPKFLVPMRTFQIGLGIGKSIGVVPEAHPSAWWAQVKGRKRWILSPPSKNPPLCHINNNRGCMPRIIATESIVCDQDPGWIMWVPEFWWHETCGWDSFSIGVGGVTFEGANLTSTEKQDCGAKPGSYSLDMVKSCVDNPEGMNKACPSLEERETFSLSLPQQGTGSDAQEEL